jgi:hypothetical protein
MLLPPVEMETQDNLWPFPSMEMPAEAGIELG